MPDDETNSEVEQHNLELSVIKKNLGEIGSYIEV